MKEIKICYAASSGGHLEEALQLLHALEERFRGFIVTEKTEYRCAAGETPCYYLMPVNRKEWTCIFRMLVNSFRSLVILMKEKPDVVISTGALATIPICLLAKLSGKKLICVESFAAVEKPTRTGKFLYRFADRFYIQWESMKRYYPDAVFAGGVYE